MFISFIQCMWDTETGDSPLGKTFYWINSSEHSEDTNNQVSLELSEKALLRRWNRWSGSWRMRMCLSPRGHLSNIWVICSAVIIEVLVLYSTGLGDCGLSPSTAWIDRWMDWLILKMSKQSAYKWSWHWDCFFILLLLFFISTCRWIGLQIS